jgi:outer membrane lipoprotein SlyB
MVRLQKTLGILTLSGALLTAGACNGGLLGNILGGGQSQQTSGQINGTIVGTDIRNQRIDVRDNSNNQTFWVQYDNRTQVTYRNQGVSPTSIRQGDNVTLQVQNNGNNSYYTNYVQIY